MPKQFYKWSAVGGLQTVAGLLCVMGAATAFAAESKTTVVRDDDMRPRPMAERLAERQGGGDGDLGAASGSVDDLSQQGTPPKKDKVVDVLKGDEIVLRSGWVVRLNGIDVPAADYGKRQGNYYGKEAIVLAKQLVMGKEVTLEFDEKIIDDYGRALAYVSVGDTMLNKALVEKGFGLAACFPPNVRYCDLFSKTQSEAVKGRVGMWNFDPNAFQAEAGGGKPANMIQGVKVADALDGDTIRLEDGTIVRYIGIDAPESEAVWKSKAFGHDSYDFNKKLVQGKLVDLEYDVEYTDPRGRDLAYVYVDGKMANEAMVEQGLAWVAVFPPNIKHIRKFLDAQQRAMEGSKGIWNTGAAK